MDNERMILKILEMYYEQELTQSEISKRLNISRPTVSRSINKAKRNGYVEIKINYPNYFKPKLESSLEEKYKLSEVIVIPNQDNKDTLEQVSYFAADYLLRVIDNNMTIALTRGITLENMVNHLKNDVRLKFLDLKNITFVPLIGDNNPDQSKNKYFRFSYSNYIIEEIAHLFDAKCYQLLAPQYLSSSNTKNVLLNEPSIQTTMEVIKNSDLAIIGIGTINKKSSSHFVENITTELLQKLESQGGIGEILAHVYDINGKLVKPSYEERIMSLEIDDFIKIPTRVGVAFGYEKKEAILGALRGEFINVLITDEIVANYLLAHNIY